MTAIDLASPFGSVEMGHDPGAYARWVERTRISPVQNGQPLHLQTEYRRPPDSPLFSRAAVGAGIAAVGDPELMVPEGHMGDNF